MNVLKITRPFLVLILGAFCSISNAQVTCGPGTYWSSAEQVCLPITECQEDLDADGMIGIGDILILLSAFAEVCELPEEISCENQITFDGYDYEVVKIGNQCWFAENLRTTVYANGEEIPSNLTDEEWSATTQGASAILWEGSSSEFVLENPDTVLWALNRFGRLYNFHAVLDPRSICPIGWHVSTDDDWLQLEEFLGLSEEELLSTLPSPRGSDIDLGHKLKESVHWMNASSVTQGLVSNAGAGGTWSNVSYLTMDSRIFGPPLLNLLGTGRRTDSGTYGSWGYSSHVWSPSDSLIMTRFTLGHWQGFGRADFQNVQSGNPVRCVLD